MLVLPPLRKAATLRPDGYTILYDYIFIFIQAQSRWSIPFYHHEYSESRITVNNNNNGTAKRARKPFFLTAITTDRWEWTHRDTLARPTEHRQQKQARVSDGNDALLIINIFINISSPTPQKGKYKQILKVKIGKCWLANDLNIVFLSTASASGIG